MYLADLAATSAGVASTRARRTKIALLAACLRTLSVDEIALAVALLSGDLPNGALGVGWAALRALGPEPAPEPSLPLVVVDAALRRIQSTTGPQSQARRHAELTGLFDRLSQEEQRFLTGVLSGGLRQGALAGIMAEAIAAAAGVPAPDVRRALLVSGDLTAVAVTALTQGAPGLATVRVRPLHPLAPMLAQSAPSTAEALARIAPSGEAGVEWKFDGVRVQVHRRGRDVAVYTRNLADATARVPTVAETVRHLPGGDLILDGELIALGPGGRPRPFQETMGAFGTRAIAQVARGGGRTPPPAPAVLLTPYFFDCLHRDGEDLVDRPGAERFDALASALPASLLVPRRVVRHPDAADEFLDAALAAGHEGVLVKSLDAPYEAGRRGAGWVKVKRALTLDLVVLAAEWGHGRRRGWLSNLHLGARDPGGGFVMLGKTFKGMTDALLAWQTERLLALETSHDAATVYVRPELVVETAFDGLQESTRYPGGLALRFARIKGYRTDKGADQADTIDAVRAIHLAAR